MPRRSTQITHKCGQCGKLLKAVSGNMHKQMIAQREAEGREFDWWFLCNSHSNKYSASIADFSTRDKTHYKDAARNAALSRRARAQFADEEFVKSFKEKMKAAHNTKEAKDHHSAASIALWEDEDYRYRTQSSLKTAHNTPETRARHSAAMKKLWKDESFAEKVILRDRPFMRLQGVKRGYYFSNRQGKSIRYDSLLELRALEKMEDNYSILHFDRCRDMIPYEGGHRYNPDFELELVDGARIVIETKGSYFDDPNSPKKEAAQTLYGKSYLYLVDNDIDIISSIV